MHSEVTNYTFYFILGRLWESKSDLYQQWNFGRKAFETPWQAGGSMQSRRFCEEMAHAVQQISFRLTKRGVRFELA